MLLGPAVLIVLRIYLQIFLQVFPFLHERFQRTRWGLIVAIAPS
jgi:hypothetical protein